jgi:hypothetical protein
MQAHVYDSVHIKLLRLFGAKSKILYIPNYGIETEELTLDYEAWHEISVWSQQFLKKKNRRTIQINFFYTVYDIKEEKIQ